MLDNIWAALARRWIQLTYLDQSRQVIVKLRLYCDHALTDPRLNFSQHYRLLSFYKNAYIRLGRKLEFPMGVHNR